MVPITDEIHLLNNARLNEIQDDVELAFWRRLKPLVHGYCSDRERPHESKDYELRFYDDWYEWRCLLRWLGVKKKCRYCGERITPDEYQEARRLEKLRDSVMETLEDSTNTSTEDDTN